jgi:uncharacterized repeat protein (TIGR01451 family)
MQVHGNAYARDFTKVIKTTDNGFLIVGSELVISGNGGDSLLVIKMSYTGAIEWKKTFGGNKSQIAYGAICTPDGGYMVVGYTNSINNGDVAGHHGVEDSTSFHKSVYARDAWLLKLSANGNLMWQKCFGGKWQDEFNGIHESPDHNYIINGYSASSDGDLTGLNRNGNSWILKINNSGNIIWQELLEQSNDLTVLNSGDIMIAGNRASNSTNIDSWDCLVTKMDNNGNILWSKTYGGSKMDRTGKITPFQDGFVISGSSASMDGDLTGIQPPDTSGFTWIYAIDAQGNIIWQKALGGFVSDICTTTENEIIVVGRAYETSAQTNFNAYMCKFSRDGSVVYEKAFGGSNSEELNSVISINSRELLITGNTVSNDGIFVGQNINSNFAGWIFKFGDVNTITGKVFLDNNGNHIYDTGEQLMNDIKVISSKGGDWTGSLLNTGKYMNVVDTGEYSTSVMYDNPNYIVSPTSHVSNFISYFNSDTADFAITPIPGKKDLGIAIIPVTPARPGFHASYRIKANNKGTTTLNAVVKLVKDSRMSIVSAIPVSSSVINDTISWQYSGIGALDTVIVDITFQLSPPPALNINDTLKLMVKAEPLTGDVSPLDNSDTLKQRVVGSFDPNDKTETHGGIISPAQISGTDPLVYVIRFQNMGTDTAFNITIRDTLDGRLDWNSLEMIDASHPYQLSIEDNNKLTWQFNNIKLPDHNVNEPASHGHIAYRIKPKSTVLLGDTIKNTAGIYFDYNLPVATNVQKTVVFSLTPLPITLVFFQAILLNNGAADVKWKTATENNVSHFEVLRSANGIDFTTIGTVEPGKPSYLFKDRTPLIGYNYYRLRTVDIDGSTQYSNTVLVNVKNENNIISSIYPNPGNGRTVNVKLQGLIQGNIRIQILDQLGRTLLSKQYSQQNSSGFKTELNLDKLSKGNYILKIIANDRLFLSTLFVQ